MAKRKITVTVDEELVEAITVLGNESVSSVVNAALVTEVERRSRAAALDRLLIGWESTFGPVSQGAIEAARAAFDDLDATSSEAMRAPSSRGRGAA
ncbi:MAG TPA: hypothetical protein VNF50_11800 [Acidimicrobiales bacterium]|nr:hypothetical protein [Acidimicrobiales bacterium]